MPNVKTAISVPNDLYKQVEKYSKRRRIPRSRIYAAGARMLLQSEIDSEITRRLNAVYKDYKPSKADRAWNRMAAQSMAKLLEGDEW